jgi:hypothetical protein
MFKRGMPTLLKFTAICEPTFDRSFCMAYMVGKFWKSSFTCNKYDIFWTSELRVMANLVEATHAAWWLRKNCRILHKCFMKMTFHLLLLVLIFTPI